MRRTAHRSIRHSLDAYIDDELALAAEATVADHVDDCPGCRDEVELARAVKASLRRLATRLPPHLAGRRLRRLAIDMGRKAER